MRNASRSLIYVLCLTTVFGPGCATILGKAGAQPVEVVTNPPGARILVDGALTEVMSPGTVEMSPKEEHSVGAVLGEAKAQSAVKKKIRLWAVIFDVIPGCGIALLVDYLTGALYALEPQVKLNLGVAPPPMVYGNNDPRPNGTNPGQANPPPSGGTRDLLDPQAACKVCGEPRGNQTPCPHCGMD